MYDKGNINTERRNPLCRIAQDKIRTSSEIKITVSTACLRTGTEDLSLSIKARMYGLVIGAYASAGHHFTLRPTGKRWTTAKDKASPLQTVKHCLKPQGPTNLRGGFLRQRAVGHARKKFNSNGLLTPIKISGGIYLC
jgi:hypothetical protein